MRVKYPNLSIAPNRFFNFNYWKGDVIDTVLIPYPKEPGIKSGVL